MTNHLEMAGSYLKVAAGDPRALRCEKAQRAIAHALLAIATVLTEIHQDLAPGETDAGGKVIVTFRPDETPRVVEWSEIRHAVIALLHRVEARGEYSAVSPEAHNLRLMLGITMPEISG